MFLSDNLQPSTKMLVAWNTVSQLVGKFLTAGTTFLVTLLIARRFGAEGYGDFTKITTYIAFFFLVADFGLNAIFLQKSKDTTADKGTWSALLGLRLTGSILLVFLALAILAFLPQGETQGYTKYVKLGIIIFSPAIVFQALLTSANAVFQKSLRYDFSTIALSVGSAATLGLLWLVTSYGSESTGVLLGVLSLLAGTVVTAAVALLLARRLTGHLKVSFQLGQAAALLVPAIPLGLTLLFNLIYFHVDSVILTLARSTAEVGIYGLAYKVFEVPLALPTFFMNAVYPLMLRQKAHELGIRNYEFVRLMKRSFSFLLVASFILLLVLWIGAPLLAVIKFDFAQSVGALRVLSLGLPFFFLSALTMWALIALGKQMLLAFIYGASMLLNLFFNILFIPGYGFMAAAWITVVSEGLVLVATGLALQQTLRSVKLNEEARA